MQQHKVMASHHAASLPILSLAIHLVPNRTRPYQDPETHQRDHDLRRSMQCMRHTKDPFFEEPQELFFFLPSADFVRASNRTSKFLAAIFIIGIPHPQSPKSRTQKREEAARQQGSLFFRENSSNGGKAIRTFWRNTKFGKIACQGLIWQNVSD